MFTSDVCWGSLGTFIFGSSGSAASNTRSRLPSRLSFCFLWLWFLQRFQNAQEISNERGSEFIPDSVELLYYYFQRIHITRAESYTMSLDWIASKKATINPKNEKDKCFKWSIIAGLHYNKIKEKELKKNRKN